jgi:uncharacterized metal-binding protein YceD (DUF177 family)
VKTAFSKITTSPKEFIFKKDNLKLVCKLKRLNKNTVFLDGVILGEITLFCDRCSEEFKEQINWPLQLRLSNVAVKEAEDLDIIEFINSDIDFETILDSEVDSYKLSYHYCQKCKESDEEFEREF